MSTGERIAPKDWNAKARRPRSTAPGASSLSAYLDRFSDKMKEVHLSLRTSMQVVTPDMLREEFKRQTRNQPGKGDLIGWIEEYSRMPQATRALKMNYHSIKEILTRYPGSKSFDDINEAWFIRFHRWMEAYREEKELPGGYKANYIHKAVRYIKEFCNEAHRNGVAKKAGWKEMKYRAEVEQVETIYLNIIELYQIRDADLPPYLRDTADLFLIGAFTALRYSDFSSITAESIRDGMIYNRNQKTGESVVVPVHPVVSEILTRRGGVLPKSITNQAMNRALKEIGRLAGLKELIEVTETRGGGKVKRTVEKYNLITTHTARRSAASNMYLAGIPAISIMKITGHKTEKSFMKYIRISQKENAELIKSHRFFS